MTFAHTEKGKTMNDYIKREDAINAVGRPPCKDSECFGVKCRYIVEIDELPSADVVEVVRCRECKHYDGYECLLWGESAESNNPISDDGCDYCSWGERKDNEID